MSGGDGDCTPGWRAWHGALVALVNGEFASRRARIVCEIAPRSMFAKAARGLVETIAREPIAPNEYSTQAIVAELGPCTTQTPAVLAMCAWLRRHLAGDLHAAVLHGSLGTGEVVAYSDFDSLVIIKDDVFEDERRLAQVAFGLFEARRFMYAHDPLQHHGWFVLPEAALASWPENYLPVAVLRQSCHMLGSERQRLAIAPVVETKRICEQFFGLAAAVRRDLEDGRHLANLYRLKGLLSKAMLLPAFYVQARDGEGIFKRESFDLARVDFTEATWAIMDHISAIRRDWPEAQPAFPRTLSLRPGLVGNLVRSYRSRPVPVLLRRRFGPKEEEALMGLVSAMEARLAHVGRRARAGA